MHQSSAVIYKKGTPNWIVIHTMLRLLLQG